MKYTKTMCLIALLTMANFAQARCQSLFPWDGVDFGSDWMTTAKSGDIVYEAVISDGSGVREDQGILCEYDSSVFQTKVAGTLIVSHQAFAPSKLNGLTATFTVGQMKLISFETSSAATNALWAPLKGSAFPAKKTFDKYPFHNTTYKVKYDAPVKVVVRRNNDPIQPVGTLGVIQPLVGAELRERAEYTRLTGQMGIYESFGNFKLSIHRNVFVPNNCSVEIGVDKLHQNISFGTLEEDDFEGGSNSKLIKKFSLTATQKNCDKWTTLNITHTSPQQTAQAGVMKTSTIDNNIEAYVRDITDVYDGDYEYAYPLEWGVTKRVTELEGQGESTTLDYEIELRKTDNSLPVRSGAFGGMINYTISFR